MTSPQKIVTRSDQSRKKLFKSPNLPDNHYAFQIVVKENDARKV